MKNSYLRFGNKKLYNENTIKEAGTEEMGDMEPKKLALLRILKILEEHSDYNHKLTQEDIANRLSCEYGITLERKAVARNISLLQEAGYEIEHEKEGYYLLERDFEESELRLLVDSVISNKFIPAGQSKALIEKLSSLSTSHFKKQITYVHNISKYQKGDNKAVFYMIDLIMEAIEKNKKIAFNETYYKADKKKYPRPERLTMNPLQIVMYEGRYALLCWDYEKNPSRYEMEADVQNFYLDNICDVEILDEKREDITVDPRYKHGVSVEQIFNKNSFTEKYMASEDENEMVTFVAHASMIGTFIDAFGQDIRIERMKDLDDLDFLQFVTVQLPEKSYLENLCYFTVKTTAVRAVDFTEKNGKNVVLLRPKKLRRYIHNELSYIDTFQREMIQYIEFEELQNKNERRS